LRKGAILSAVTGRNGSPVFIFTGNECGAKQAKELDEQGLCRERRMD
jgi:hypothetical protein